MLRKANEYRIKIIVALADVSFASSAIRASRNGAMQVWKTPKWKTRDVLSARQR